MTSIPGPPPDCGESQSRTVIQMLVPTQISDEEEIAPSRSSLQPKIAQEKPTIPDKSKKDIPSMTMERKAHEAADEAMEIALQAGNGCTCPRDSGTSGDSGGAVNDSSQAAASLVLTDNDVVEKTASKLSKDSSSDDSSQGQCEIEDATTVEEPFAQTMKSQELSEPRVQHTEDLWPTTPSNHKG